MRAVAVLLVVTFHAFPNTFDGGFIGVDIFFVISGFLISSIILENLDAGTFSFVTFYGRRIRRIIPALSIVLIASLVFGWFELLPGEYKQLGKHVAGGASFLSNFLLLTEHGYFDNPDAKPLLHLWSLGIEEQFYIIWPLLLFLMFRLRLNLLAVIAVVALSSFLLNTEITARGAFIVFRHAPPWQIAPSLAGLLRSYPNSALSQQDALNTHHSRS